MAIIKCPECGHQISDKAPVCPSCGVEIAGKVIKCANCGEIYFNYQEMCPNCHVINPLFIRQQPTAQQQPQQPTVQQPQPQQPQPQQPVVQQPIQQPTPAQGKPVVSEKNEETSAASVTPPTTPVTPPATPRTTVPPTPKATVPPVRPDMRPSAKPEGNEPSKEETEKKKKNNRTIFIISFIFAIIVCGVMYYFYDSANKSKELEAYEFAMQSNDPTVLQSYLDNYKDADEAHRDSIEAHLLMLQQNDQDWTNACVSGSKEALEAYLSKYPNSPHKQEAYNKIDSIDWAFAMNQDTAEGYQAYLDTHADGSHIEEAENALKKVKSRDLQPEEKQMISGLFRQFFQSINSRNEDGLTATCEDILSSLLGKSSATKSDVVTFMNKLYKDDITNMNWHINNDYQIKKREVGDAEYEYQVQFSARQDIDQADGSKKENTFKISGTVSPDGKISSFNMAKVTTGE